jgi:uncharacterized protein (DUF697 family)
LVAVAEADGVLLPAEERAIEKALAEADVPGVSLLRILERPIDLDAELAVLSSEEARRAAFDAAFALAHVDGQSAPAEEALLAKLEAALADARAHRTVLKRVVDEAEDTVLPSHIGQIVDPALRAKEIREDIWKYSVIAAALGAFPVPGLAIVTDLGVSALQVKLVRDVAQYFGKKFDTRQGAELVAGAGVGMGMRIALDNLAKLIPGWGSAVGAASAFASTYALGVVTTRYFEAGGVDASMLATGFAEAEREARKAMDDDALVLSRFSLADQAEIRALSDALARGELTRDQYMTRIDHVVHKPVAED